MREEDSQHISRLIRARVLGALHQLDRLARRKEKGFQSDHQLRACIALVRLAPQVLGQLADDEDQEEDPLAHLDEDPQRELAGRRLAYLDSMTVEQQKEFGDRKDAAIEEWRKSIPAGGLELAEYHKTHPIKNISEVEDEQWPPHLRKSTMKEAADE